MSDPGLQASKDDRATRGKGVSHLSHFAGSTWFAPAALALLFVGVAGMLIWLCHARALEKDRTNLATSVHTAQESIRLRLHAAQDHLVTLAEDMARETLSQDLITKRLVHHMGEHPELVSAMYVDVDGTARWAVPPQWEEKVLGRPLACRRSLECCREAQRTRSLVYSDVHISLQNEPAFDLSIPIYNQDKFLGSIVGVHSCGRMLQTMISREVVHEHRASLIDGQGNTIVVLPTVARIDERLSATAELDPPGQGLSLRLDRYGSGFWSPEMMLLAASCVGLALGMSWGMWSLRLQVARRAKAEQMLHEAHDELAQRVRERTAELETANQRLQCEIDERRRAEEQSRQHQDELAHLARVGTLGEMATGLAHELNQPLGAIASFAEGGVRLMESGQATPEALHKTLTEVCVQARRAGQIIHRVRSFVATGQPKRESYQLKALAGELIELVATELRQEQINLHLDVPEHLPPVLVDGIQAQQVLANLIRNAVDALRQVDVGRRRIEVTATPTRDGTVTVSVSDTGPGCGPEVVEKMFDAFFTTKKSGLGMGLPISRSIIEAHGGRMWSVVNASGGLTVHFTIPTAVGERDVSVQRT